jgi:hypothetical protein
MRSFETQMFLKEISKSAQIQVTSNETINPVSLGLEILFNNSKIDFTCEYTMQILLVM